MYSKIETIRKIYSFLSKEDRHFQITREDLAYVLGMSYSKVSNATQLARTILIRGGELLKDAGLSEDNAKLLLKECYFINEHVRSAHKPKDLNELFA